MRFLRKERETHLLGRRPQRYGFTATAIRIGKLIGLRWCVFHVAQGFPSVFPVGHHFDLLTPKAYADQEGNEGEVAQERGRLREGAESYAKALASDILR